MSKNKTSLQRIKIVLIGIENSGKSTLVKELSPNAKSIEHYQKSGDSITVGLDIGKIELAGCSLHFFGTPGHQRFEFARKIISRGAHIGMLMIDSEEATKKGIGQREKDFERELIEMNIPYLICANKRDTPDVVPLAQIESHFSANVYPISAKQGQGIDELRDALVQIIGLHKNGWFSESSNKLKLA